VALRPPLSKSLPFPACRQGLISWTVKVCLIGKEKTRQAGRLGGQDELAEHRPAGHAFLGRASLLQRKHRIDDRMQPGTQQR